MIVRNWMTTDVVTIGKDASIQEAMTAMRRHSIRHLPVVDGKQRLLGWVTDADLRGALIASMLEELTVEDVMIHQPVVASSSMPLEDAAKLILEKRIGGFPIVDDNKVVGVITVVDILAAFINMLGLLTSSSRIDVKVAGGSSELDEVTRIIRESGAQIISVCHLPMSLDRDRVYSFRLEKCDVGSLVEVLKESGLEVSSAIA